ncbi:MAG: hypothetical protein HQL75_07070 [Magnetococcales bacterium]|nr:hypothetical protein [Magnetococcales bacterium]
MSATTPSSNLSSLPPDPSVPATSLVDDDAINLIELWDTLVRGKYLIITFTIIATILALLQALSSNPIYRAEVLLLPVTGEESTKSGVLANLGGAAQLLGLGSQSSNSTVFATAKLKSKAFIESFLREENLIKVLYADRWDAEKQKWKKKPIPRWKRWLGLPDESPSTDEPPSMWDAVQLFNNILSINENKKDGLITLAIEWGDREQATLWANHIVERINLFLRDLAIQDARKSMEFLNEEFERTQIVVVRNAIASLQEGQMKRIMMASVKTSYAFDIIDPAVVPPENAYVRPQKSRIVLTGIFGGLFAGVFAVFLRHMIRQQKKTAATKSYKTSIPNTQF